MYPMVKSQNTLRLTRTNGSLVEHSYSTRTLYKIGNEMFKFDGIEAMSPLSFDQFTIILRQPTTNWIKAGVSILNESTMECQTVYVHLPTRIIHSITRKFEYNIVLNAEKNVKPLDEDADEEIIRSQRYTKEVRFMTDPLFYRLDQIYSNNSKFSILIRV
jgi:regulation of enolase protein 1 (concanavalin A-like superfamily)